MAAEAEAGKVCARRGNCFAARKFRARMNYESHCFVYSARADVPLSALHADFLEDGCVEEVQRG